MSPSTVKVLRDHNDNLSLTCRKLATTLGDNDLIFLRWDGSPLRPSTISYVWTKLAKTLGIIASRLHDARHTHDSLILKQDTHPKVVQERLGHSTISMTLDIYCYIVPGLQKAAAEKFDEVFQINDNQGDNNTAIENSLGFY